MAVCLGLRRHDSYLSGPLPQCLWAMSMVKRAYTLVDKNNDHVQIPRFRRFPRKQSALLFFTNDGEPAPALCPRVPGPPDSTRHCRRYRSHRNVFCKATINTEIDSVSALTRRRAGKGLRLARLSVAVRHQSSGMDWLWRPLHPPHRCSFAKECEIRHILRSGRVGKRPAKAKFDCGRHQQAPCIV